jgi:hypothetical protein
MDLRWGAAFVDCEVLVYMLMHSRRGRTKIKEWCSWADEAKTAI